jgi:mannose-6-phosphate isomerase-like protein (cupin superfamily)
MELGRGVLYQAGDGERLEARGSVMLFKAISATTHGRLSLMERTLPAGGRMPPAHAHVETEEAYFVLEGEVAFFVDGNQAKGGSGCFVLVPAGVSHTFGNTSRSVARLLVIHVPGLDSYFRELQSLWSSAEPPSREAEQQLMTRHGMYPT